MPHPKFESIDTLFKDADALAKHVYDALTDKGQPRALKKNCSLYGISYPTAYRFIKDFESRKGKGVFGADRRFSMDKFLTMAVAIKKNGQKAPGKRKKKDDGVTYKVVAVKQDIAGTGVAVQVAQPAASTEPPKTGGSFSLSNLFQKKA